MKNRDWQIKNENKNWVYKFLLFESLYSVKIFRRLMDISFFTVHVSSLVQFFYPNYTHASFHLLLHTAFLPSFYLHFFLSFFSFFSPPSLLPLLLYGFPFFLSISFFGKSDFSIHYLLSLEEIPLSFASGERMRILFIGQGSK